MTYEIIIDGVESPQPEESIAVDVIAIDTENQVETDLNARVAPEGWLTRTGLVKRLGVNDRTVQRWIREAVAENPELVQDFRVEKGGVYPHLHPDFVKQLEELHASQEDAPINWVSKGELETEFGISTDLATKLIGQFLDDHDPEEITRHYKSRGNGKYIPHYNKEEIVPFFESQLAAVPEDWLTVGAMVKIIGRDTSTVRKAMERLAEEMPDLAENSTIRRGTRVYHSPDYFQLIKEGLDQRFTPPPQGWISLANLRRELGKSKNSLNKFAELLRTEHSDWFEDFYDVEAGRVAEHCHPEFVALAAEKFSTNEPAPDGWETVHGLMGVFERGYKYLSRVVDEIEAENPELTATYLDKGGRVARHIHPEALEVIRARVNQYEDAPEGWATGYGLSKALDGNQKTIDLLASKLLAEHPEWLSDYRDSTGQVRKHYHPELVSIIAEAINHRNMGKVEKQEIDQLQSNLETFMAGVSEAQTLESQEFHQLLNLFGSERAVDILFQYRPEYQKVSLPFAKRVIGDYLGEFLVVRGDLQLDKLEMGVQYLSAPSLKEGLREVIKNDCLRAYNQLRREGLVDNDFSTLQNYVTELRRKTESYSTTELTEVIDEVEEYYKALFEAIQIPDNVVNELEPGRLFPDINQRINILELMGKQKMLIADEMGVGKSASAILAKESLGVRQALVVVPSNVVEVWQKYLSDYTNGDGSAKGYFKKGQAPRVLTINNGLDSLKDLDFSEYDYVIISQERLTDEYTPLLEQIDYDMLIVDEAHKLKNITSGKRADNLIKLAEKIEGDDRYLALLSGTPVPNHVSDIAMVLRLLYPEKFEGVANKDLTRQILDGDVLDLRSLLVPRMQMKSLAESIEMPTLHEELHAVQMSDEERDAYEVLLEEDELTASQKLQILRQFALNPEIFEMTPGFQSSKLKAVGESLRTTFADKNKVVMFVNGYIDGVIRGENTIFDSLELPEDVEVHVIDGKVPKASRLEIQKMLQEQSERRMLLAVSGQTADVGVDFSGAEELYFYNEPWTEYDKRQQQGRVYRPGLRHDLVSHTFYVEGSVEEGIHKYIEYKYNAVEKLLRGIPLSELEREMLREDEKQVDPNLEVNPTLAEHYLSSWHRMLKIYSYVKGIGEEDFVKFLGKYGREYAECYTDLGSRSYQANVGRLAGTTIDKLARSKKQDPQFVRILDVASGPEMLKRHIGEEYQDRVVSVDINPHHFEQVDEKRRVGSFLGLPVADTTIDYANLSLALHYTKLSLRQGVYEPIKVFQELNRVLVNEGVAVINLMHNNDLKDPELFAQAIEKVGFKVVEGLSGEVSSANNFKSRMLVLQKVSSCTQDTAELVQQMGTQILHGFKLAKTDVKLKDSRKIVTNFVLNGAKKMRARMNGSDQSVLEEEQSTLSAMKSLRRKYGSIQKIPKDIIYQSGLSRAFTGKTYVLFKSLETGNGAVITR